MSIHQAIKAAEDNRVPFWPRLLSADMASSYMGISKRNFLDRAATHMLPAGRNFGARKVWDRHQLDEFVDAMFGNDEAASNKDNFFGD